MKRALMSIIVVALVALAAVVAWQWREAPDTAGPTMGVDVELHALGVMVRDATHGRVRESVQATIAALPREDGQVVLSSPVLLYALADLDLGSARADAFWLWVTMLTPPDYVADTFSVWGGSRLVCQLRPEPAGGHGYPLAEGVVWRTYMFRLRGDWQSTPNEAASDPAFEPTPRQRHDRHVELSKALRGLTVSHADSTVEIVLDWREYYRAGDEP